MHMFTVQAEGLPDISGGSARRAAPRKTIRRVTHPGGVPDSRPRPENHTRNFGSYFTPIQLRNPSFSRARFTAALIRNAANISASLHVPRIPGWTIVIAMTAQGASSTDRFV
jgi:hypothetical protein